jgi:hypothetical protein
MLVGPGDLIESHHLASRPAAPLFVLGWGVLFWILLSRQDMEVHPWVAVAYGAIASWFTFAAIWLHRRAPRRVAVHENGINVTFGGRRMRYLPWSEISGIEVDTYDRRSAAFLQTISITLVKGSSLIMNVRDSRRLVEQIAEHVLPRK